MRNLYLLLLVLITLFNCSINEAEKKLIGQWNNFPMGGSSDIKFYKDSIVIFDYGEKRIGKWNANSSIININFTNTDSEGKRNYNLFYKISSNNDTLLTKIDTVLKDMSYMSLLKVNDNWEHYLREINLDINLPTASFKIFEKDSSSLGIDIYVGYENNKLSIKTYGGSKLENLERIKSLVYNMKSTKNKEEIIKLNFNLIADKKVSEEKIDSIKEVLRNFPEIKIFRVYRNDEENYGKYDITLKGNLWNWYGKYE